MVDDFVAKLFGMGTASKTATVGLQTTAKAEVAVGTAAKTASVGVKVLSTALKAVGIGLILAGIAKLLELGEKLIGWLGDWSKGNADLVSSEKLVQRSIDMTNDKLKEEIELIEKRYKAGTSSYGEKMTQQQKAYGEAIKEATRLLNIQLGVASKSGKDKSFAKSALGQLTLGNDKGVTTVGGFTQGIKSIKELEERWNALRDAVSKGIGIEANKELNTLNLSASDCRDELSHLEQVVAGKLISSFEKFDITTKEGAVAFANFVKGVKENGNEVEKSVLFRMADILSDERPELKKALQGYLDLINNFADQWNSVDIASDFMAQVTAGLEKANPAAAAQKILDNYRQQEQYVWFTLTEDQKTQAKEYEKKLEQDVKDANKKITSATKKGYDEREKKIEEAERRIADLKMSLLRSSRDKELSQLKANNDKVIAEIKKNGVRVEEQQKLQKQKFEKESSEIIEKYDKEIEDIADNNYLESVQLLVDKLNDSIEDLTDTTYKISPILSSMDFADRFKEGAKEAANLKEVYQDLLNFWNKNNVSLLEKNPSEVIGEFLKEYPKYTNPNSGVDSADLQSFFDQIKNNTLAFIANERDANRTLEMSLQARIETYETFYLTSFENLDTYLTKREEVLKEGLAKEEQIERAALDKWYNNNKSAGESEEDLRYNEKLLETYEVKKIQITQKYEAKRKQIEKDAANERRQVTTKLYRDGLDDLEDFYSSIEKLTASQPIKNNFGFIDIKATKDNYKEAEKALDRFQKDISKKRADLVNKKNKGFISDDDYNAAVRQLENLEERVRETRRRVKDGVKGIPEEVVKETLEVVNIALDAVNQIVGSIDEIQQAKYEKQKESLEKETENLEKQLQKQKEITEKYSNSINEIEDELGDSRGARRQYLIDQLNAQMEAQRESLAQEKKIEKEKEKMKKKEEELDKEESKRKKKMALIQAAINTALSISYAAMNSWPMPAIAMMAAAAAVGAAQIAAISAQKYGDGGLLQGKSHKEGGIKVLGGQAEVEGGEYVTNKRTTAKNLPLLEYINGKNKKVELSDLIDFYSNKAGNSIKSSSPKRIFADGGQIPSLNTDLQFNSRLIQAMEDYSNRPTVVSVVDIIDRTSSVNNVRTLAGLS